MNNGRITNKTARNSSFSELLTFSGGKMDASEYKKEYILVCCFLKRVSDVFEVKRQELKEKYNKSLELSRNRLMTLERP